MYSMYKHLHPPGTLASASTAHISVALNLVPMRTVDATWIFHMVLTGFDPSKSCGLSVVQWTFGGVFMV